MNYRQPKPESYHAASTVLRVKLSGRLGNNIVQLINSVTISHLRGINEILFSFAGWGQTGDNIAAFLTDIIRLPSGITIMFTDNHRGLQGYHAMIDDVHLEGAVCDYLSRSEDRDAVRNDLDYIFKEAFLPAVRLRSQRHGYMPNIDTRTALIHLRGEDVFGYGVSDIRHMPINYPQPPLAFYKLTISRIISQTDFNLVLLYQDMRNPVLSLLGRYLAEKNIPFQAHRLNIFDSVSSILSCGALVSSRGTFSSAIAMLSGSTKDYYYFREVELQHMHQLCSPSSRIYLVQDLKRKYINKGDWYNLECQHKLMLRYPTDYLSMSCLGVDI